MSPTARIVVGTILNAAAAQPELPFDHRDSRRSRAAVAAASRLNGLPELTIVIPTYNERENIGPLLERLREALARVQWEVIFVDDDSPDGTATAVQAFAAKDPKIRLIQRYGKRGLSSACIEGMHQSKSRYIAVMDADLQHDERVLPTMLGMIRTERLDAVVGSRTVPGASMGKFALHRRLLSKLGTRVSGLVTQCNVTDAMSGFFVVDRRFFLEVADFLTATGFKILLDILASSSRPVRVAEVPYQFGKRLHGASKLAVRVELEYLYLLLDKVFGRWVRQRLRQRVPI